MLAQVDEKTLAMNFALLIGAAVLLGASFIIMIALITALKCAFWVHRRRKAEREFLMKYRRADGARYPPFMEGICGTCGQGNNKIYFTPTGEELCPPCYERFWHAGITISGASKESVTDIKVLPRGNITLTVPCNDAGRPPDLLPGGASSSWRRLIPRRR